MILSSAIFFYKKNKLIYFIEETFKDIGSSIFHKAQNWYGMKQKAKIVIDEKFLIRNMVAFTDKLVYKSGEIIKLRLIGNRKIDINIFKVANKGENDKVLELELELNNGSFATFSTFDGILSPYEEINLKTSKLGTGWFKIEIKSSDKQTYEIPLFIDPYKIKNKILFVESTDTFKAYNRAYYQYLIPNYYDGGITPKGTVVIPKNTPFIYKFLGSNEINCHDHLMNSDLIHKTNLQDIGINFTPVSDNFLDQPDKFKNIDTIIFGSHNEYWTSAKAKNIMEFVDNGGKVLFLGGNHAWRQVFRDVKRTWFNGDGLRNYPIFDKLINNYLGTYFTKSDYNTYADFKITNNILLKNRFSLEIEEGVRIGKGTKFLHCNKFINGASGFETDKLTSESIGFTILAQGQNKNGGADVVYKLFPKGGEVLNFSSVSLWHNKDERINNIIREFIKY